MATEDVNRVRTSDIVALERSLRKCVMEKAKPGVSSEEDTLKRAFKRIDVDESGEVDFNEFLAAMETFGVEVTEGSGARLAGQGTSNLHGGIPLKLVRALFDKYDADGSGSLSYGEFAEGLFTKFVGGAPTHAVGMPSSTSPTGRRAGAGSRWKAGHMETGDAHGTNPWLPALQGSESLDPNYQRPNGQRPAVRALSLANPKWREAQK